MRDATGVIRAGRAACKPVADGRTHNLSIDSRDPSAVMNILRPEVPHDYASRKMLVIGDMCGVGG
jgi:hypothetical protein